MTVRVASYAFPHFTIHLSTKRSVQLPKAYYHIRLLTTICNIEHELLGNLRYRPTHFGPLGQRTSRFYDPWLSCAAFVGYAEHVR